ncbi:hypothetical protein M885DRAFT_516232 [Pelagophyceae sp. CCMP2097]|nr:hypothetical protein M885DRAFT_516232 [Pelagophyceae sp. CCMP2097]|mmetsp:Transcript_18873/g.64921  ORF Transcript_18873/g.64921 Transcript_18873/m.64921 type:complete len:266 (-) Transcript_18873:352-1149(-)
MSPRHLQRFLLSNAKRGLNVSVEKTDCIVRFNKHADVLVCPANEYLCGAVLPYFPRGGPCPPQPPTGASANSWGALDVGPGFLFAAQAVDGVVSQCGGKALREACNELPVINDKGHRCQVGHAIPTRAAGQLAAFGFKSVVHCVAPFYDDTGWDALLERTYLSAWAASASAAGASASAGSASVATPLLGAGARGAPVRAAAAVAARAALKCAAAGGINCAAAGGPAHIRFAVVDVDAYDALANAFAELIALHPATVKRAGAAPDD